MFPQFKVRRPYTMRKARAIMINKISAEYLHRTLALRLVKLGTFQTFHVRKNVRCLPIIIVVMNVES